VLQDNNQTNVWGVSQMTGEHEAMATHFLRI
jgi:hypothetical protein